MRRARTVRPPAASPKIGANSVVIHDVPPNTTVVGIPGHPVRVEGRKPEGPDTDKNDIEHAFAASYVNPENDHVII